MRTTHPRPEAGKQECWDVALVPFYPPHSLCGLLPNDSVSVPHQQNILPEVLWNIQVLFQMCSSGVLCGVRPQPRCRATMTRESRSGDELSPCYSGHANIKAFRDPFGIFSTFMQVDYCSQVFWGLFCGRQGSDLAMLLENNSDGIWCVFKGRSFTQQFPMSSGLQVVLLEESLTLGFTHGFPTHLKSKSVQ